MLEKHVIYQKMNELSEKISYKFKDIDLLAQALYASKLPKEDGIGENNDELCNEALSFVGDAILKFLLADYLYSSPTKTHKRKGKMTKEKEGMENNSLLHIIAEKEGIIAFAYKDDYFQPDAPEHDKIPTKEHDPYIEAITAAIYYDAGIDAVKKWFDQWLLPMIKKHKNSCPKS